MKDKELSETIQLWDAENLPPEGQWITALWRDFGKGDDTKVYSVPRLVEQRASELRAQYLAWIYDFGEAIIDGKRLVDHLELRPGLSYWWMTLPCLISYGGISSVYNAVRLLALEHLARELGSKTITLVSDDPILAEAISKWCGKAKLAFLWHRIGAKQNSSDFSERILKALPYPLQGLIYLLRHIKQRWPLRRGTKPFDSSSQGSVTFVDYLINLNSEDVSQGRFGSNYWTDLINVLKDEALLSNWVHHYIPHSLTHRPLQAKNIIDKFNQTAAGSQSHATLDSALSFSVIWNAAKDYAHILAKGVKFRSLRLPFIPKGSDVDFEPLIRKDWQNFMFSHAAISSCLFLNQFEFLLKRMPQQKLGIYLHENQPWEMAFIYAWKSAGHGRLVGLPHTTVLFWDTRYYFDPRSYQRKGRNDLPMPSLVALNGPASIGRYRDGGYPEDQMIEVEALRYLYLENFSLVRPPSENDATKALHVLVLGDYFSEVTRHQMELLLAAARNLPLGTRYTFKPHPAGMIKTSDYSSALQLHMASAPLAELLADCDVAFTGNITSAAVDAYCFGVPVVSILDGNAFNMSPLRGLKNVVYVTNSDELAAALGNAKQRDRVLAEPYFCLDKKLPRWRKLLGLSTVMADSANKKGEQRNA
jgi:surface carbohydrate biosynthesis protein (TIGR04326 family)